MKTTAVEIPRPTVTGCTIEFTRDEALVLLVVTGLIGGLRSGPRGMMDTLAEQILDAFDINRREARKELGIQAEGTISINDKETA